MKTAGLLGILFLAGCGSGGGYCATCGKKDSGVTHNPFPDMSTMPGAKRVFVTRTTYTGNLQRFGGSGVAAGDNICNTAAQGAVLGGSWRAWLSDAEVNAIDHLPDVGPWYLVGTGAKAFNNKANLAGTPLVAIDHDETGGFVTQALVWTGTGNGGLRTLDNCTSWSDEGGRSGGTVGTTVVEVWTDFTQAAGTPPCTVESSYHLYCFEM